MADLIRHLGSGSKAGMTSVKFYIAWAIRNAM